MKKGKIRILTNYFVFITMLAGALCLTSPIYAGDKTSAYERVLRTGVLRCGYIHFPPFFEKNVNTGEFSGINYDIVELMAHKLGLKVEWAAEISFGQSSAALQANKVDAICATEGPLNLNAAKYVRYTSPLGFWPFYVYTKQDSTFTTSNMDKLNTADVKFVGLDGDATISLAQDLFPKATAYALPELADPSQLFFDVTTGKATAVINDALSFVLFQKSNPGKIKKLSTTPVNLIPNAISVGIDEFQLEGLLSVVIKDMYRSGQIPKIIKKYDPNAEFYREWANDYK